MVSFFLTSAPSSIGETEALDHVAVVAVVQLVKPETLITGIMT